MTNYELYRTEILNKCLDAHDGCMCVIHDLRSKERCNTKYNCKQCSKDNFLWLEAECNERNELSRKEVVEQLKLILENPTVSTINKKALSWAIDCIER